MKNSAFIIDTRQSAYTKLAPVPIGAVNLGDDFWAPRRETNARVTLPSQFAMCAETGRFEQMQLAAKSQPVEGNTEKCGTASDSDVYKWLEGACWQLASGNDEALRAQVETVVSLIEAMQKSDGYLHSYYDRPGALPRYTGLSWSHELYCFGHFMQAAVAHRRSTGSTRLLDVAVKLADHVVETFGDGDNQRRETDGHEEIEMALVELARETGDERYLRQARFFLDLRGQGTLGNIVHCQDDVPLRQMQTANGHAVCAAYFFTGATDVFAETGDKSLHCALHRLWENVTQRRMYISGGIGARHRGEAFGEDYELPNARAYAESCASIAVVMWAQRMLHVEARSEYSDVLERVLYNSVLSGLAFEGEDYFYVNPLQSDGMHRRQKWFTPACCPTNLARLMAQLPGYFFSTSSAGQSDALWTHLYASCEVNADLPSGVPVSFRIETAYPFDGDVRFTLQNDAEFALYLRIPAWCDAAKIVMRRGGEIRSESAASVGQYFCMSEQWQGGDVVELSLPMPPRAVRSHPYVLENTGRFAVMRGPLLYCAESHDNPGIDLRDIKAEVATLQAVEGEGVLRGISMLHGDAEVVQHRDNISLYNQSPPDAEMQSSITLTLLPYYAWANRESGAMQVWLREASEPSVIPTY